MNNKSHDVVHRPVACLRGNHRRRALPYPSLLQVGLLVLFLSLTSAAPAAVINFFAGGDSKTAGSGSVGHWSDNLTSAYTNLPALYAVGGYRIEDWYGGVLGGAIDDRTTPFPKYCTLNLGVNNASTSWSSNSIASNYVGIIYFLTNKWPGTKIVISRVWDRGDAANCTNINVAISNVCMTFPGMTYLGPDEVVWLQSTDNGATYTSDGTHYSDPAGLLQAGAQWKAVLDAIEATNVVTTHYLDSGVTTSGDGSTWATAWKDWTNVTGLNPGDTLYISGGPSGSSRFYRFNSISPTYPGIWLPVSGTAGSPITYKIGQDASHNGTAYMWGYGGGSGYGYWLGYQNGTYHDIIISGDAGDGGMHFALTNYATGAVLTYWARARISYVNWGYMGEMIEANTCGNIEVDHTWLYNTDMSCDHSSFFLVTNINYGNSSFHHNTMYAPGIGNGIGADSVDWQEGGVDFYSNNIIGYVTNGYATGQHMDGLVTSQFSYSRVYDNTFIGIQDYAFYIASESGHTNVQVYNNRFYNCGGSIQIGLEGNCPPIYVTNLSVMNNTIDNGLLNTAQSMGIGNTGAGGPATWVSTWAANNIIINGNNFAWTGWTNAGPNSYSNVFLTSAQASNAFSGYVAGATNNDLRPLSTASLLVSQGTNLTAWLTTDAYGSNRAATGPWTVGAFEPISGSPAAPASGGTATATTMSAKNVHVGTP